MPWYAVVMLLFCDKEAHSAGIIVDGAEAALLEAPFATATILAAVRWFRNRSDRIIFYITQNIIIFYFVGNDFLFPLLSWFHALA
jgi:hypothetical protein